MHNNCHICNHESFFLLTKDNFNLFKCSFCDLVFINPSPAQNFLNEEIYSFESGYQSNKITDLSKTIETKKTREILEFITRNNLGKRILDVGCSSGEFMYQAKKRGFEVFGVELNKRTADIAKNNGLNIFNGLLNDAKFSENFFDVIFLGDIIEHVLSPRDFVFECKRILNTGGIIVISTPNLDCLWSKITFFFYKIFDIPWSSITPPYHTFQFSEKNLDMLMMKNSFDKLTSWFYKPPRLMYELGSLHLLKRYKNQKSTKNLLFMIFSFFIYSISYPLIIGTRFLRKKDFSMIAIYKKHG